jgi:hypothetical protein
LKIDIEDVSNYFTPLEDYFPCCPICENEIGDWSKPVIINSHGSIALAHASCVDEIDEHMEKREF